MHHPLTLAAGTVLDADAFAVVDAAAQAGFTGVGLRVTHDHAVRPDRLDDLAAHCRQRSITVHDVEVHRLGSGVDHAPLVELAASLGAAWMLVVSDLTDDAQGRANTCRRLRRIVAAAERVGVRVGFEYTSFTTPRSSAAAVQIAQDTGARVVLDLLHHHRLGEGVAAIAAVVDSGALGWVQVCDAPLRPPADLVHEARHHRALPGQGELPLGEWLALVPAGVTLSAEVQNDHLTATTSAAERAAMAFAATAAVDGR